VMAAGSPLIRSSSHWMRSPSAPSGRLLAAATGDADGVAASWAGRVLPQEQEVDAGVPEASTASAWDVPATATKAAASPRLVRRETRFCNRLDMTETIPLRWEQLIRSVPETGFPVYDTPLFWKPLPCIH